MSNITPGLSHLVVAASELRTHPRNVRQGNLDLIAESLGSFGQLKPIVCMPDGTIVAGNHTFMAATEKLGWAEVAAVKVDLSEQEALRFLLADNRTGDESSYHQEGLAAILNELMEAGALEGTGYTPDDVDDVNDGLNVIEAEFDGGYSEDPAVTEARYQQKGEDGGIAFKHKPMKDVVLLYPDDQFAQIQAMVTGLKKKWGIDSTRDVFAECIDRVAKEEGVYVAVADVAPEPTAPESEGPATVAEAPQVA